MKKAATAKAQGKQPEVKNMKRNQPVTMKSNKYRKTGYLGPQARSCLSGPHQEPCGGKYYFNIGKTHATTRGK